MQFLVLFAKNDVAKSNPYTNIDINDRNGTKNQYFAIGTLFYELSIKHLASFLLLRINNLLQSIIALTYVIYLSIRSADLGIALRVGVSHFAMSSRTWLISWQSLIMVTNNMHVKSHIFPKKSVIFDVQQNHKHIASPSFWHFIHFPNRSLSPVQSFTVRTQPHFYGDRLDDMYKKAGAWSKEQDT